MTRPFPTARRIMFSVLTAAWASVLLWPVDVSAKAQLDLAAEVQKLQKLGVPGVLAFVRDGDKEVRAVSGLADVESKRRISGTEVWRIASVTKLVTAIIMQRLAEDGLVTISKSHLKATSRGRLLLRIIAACFDAYLNPSATVLQFSKTI